MDTTTPDRNVPTEISILARILGIEHGRLSRTTARHLLTLHLGNRDKARMGELATRNQADYLSPTEKDELFAYVKAGTLLSILKSRARRVLKVTAKNSSHNISSK